MPSPLPRFGFALLAFVLGTSLAAAEERLIFEDDFERNESQEKVDEVGRGWGTNSARRAAGKKQVDLRDGAMHIVCHEVADHAVSVTHPAKFRDGAVALRFQLPNSKDNLGLNFADLEFKEVHAGHLFVVRISAKQVELTDLKTGNMKLETRELRMAKKLTPELRAELATKTKRFPHRTEVGRWHDVRVDVHGETLTVAIDGKRVGSLASAGVAHPTKRMLRLSVPHSAVVDDVKIFAVGEE